MSRANPFGDLDDFAPRPDARPVLPDAIEQIAQASGFLSRKVQAASAFDPVVAPVRQQRRHTTGRNRQINIKATEETIATLYRIADERRLPLGALLEQALAAFEANMKTSNEDNGIG